MPRMRATDPAAVRRCLSLLLAAAALVAQDRPKVAFLRVDDLLQAAPCNEPYLTSAPLRGRRLLLGEDVWLGREYDAQAGGLPVLRGNDAWFDSASLTTLLGDWLRREGDAPQLLPRLDTLVVRGGYAPAVEELLDLLRQRLPPAVRIDLELVRYTDGDEQVLLARALDATAGRRTWASDTRSGMHCVDFEVEIAQGSQIANPIVHRVDDGTMVVVRPVLSPNDPEGWFEVIARVVQPGGEPAIDCGTALAPIDRVHQHVSEFAGIVPARLGSKVRQRWGGADGGQYELRLTATWQVPAPVRPGGHDLEFAPAWNDLSGFRSVPWNDNERDRDAPPPAVTEFKSALQVANLDVRGGDAPFAYAVDGVAEELRAVVRARHAAQRPIAVRIVAYDAPAGTKIGLDGQPTANARILGVAALTTVEGSWATATAFEEMSVLEDWDVEVAQSARIPDPRCRRLAAGLFVNVRCVGGQVELDGEVLLRSPITSRVLLLDQAVDVPGSVRAVKAGESVSVQEQPAVHLPQNVVRIEDVTVSRLPLSARLPLRRDTVAQFRSDRSLMLPAGRELIVTVQRSE